MSAWIKILTSAPLLVDSARKVYETTQKKRASKSATMEEIRSNLEANDTKLAELISQMATQGEALSRGLERLDELRVQVESQSARAARLLLLGTSALIVAATAVVLSFVL